MANYYLAIDLGASGGRHMLGHIENGKLLLEEVHRFSNVPQKKDGSLVWDIEFIYSEVVKGIEKCPALLKEKSGELLSIGIDTWGVDYVLLDKDEKLIEPVFAYRDTRTEPFLNTSMTFEERYRITGTANQPFNTIYQLLADKAAGRLDKAAYMLQLPEYLSQRLAGDLKGKEYNEYTMASTTALLDAGKMRWAEGIFKALDIPAGLFKPPKLPPYTIGSLSGSPREKTGLAPKIVMIASHDTASAVAVVEEGTLYISSGTWSLLGVAGDPVLTDEARKAGYTNEGAHNGRVRFLKNIMGLWVIQSVRHELGDAYTFAELEAMAREAGKTADEGWTIDLNLPRFFSPSSMIAEIKDEYAKTGKKVPETPGELTFCVYTSLAQCYKDAVLDLEKITGKKYAAISIIGGGSKDSYLNAMTAQYTGKKVLAGPAEATAIGNVLLQMKAADDPAVENGFSGLVKSSFGIKEF